MASTDLEAVMARSKTNQPRGPSPDLPKWVKPQLCKLVDAPPQGPEWLHEIKYDGYRMHAHLDHGRVSLLTRTGPNGPLALIAAALSVLPIMANCDLCRRPERATNSVH